MNLQMHARLARRRLRRLAQCLYYRRLSLRGVPVLFANSFPKSGTHLLTQVLQAFSHIGPAVDSGLPALVTFQGDSGRMRTQAEILADLRRLLPGDIAYGHLHALPEVVDFLCQAGFVAYFILRDPRDVVVSHVFYVTEMEPRHVHHHYYALELHTFSERLRASIVGIPDSATPLPNIRERFLPYMGWLERPQVLALRYEELLADRRNALSRIYDHALKRGFPARFDRERAVAILEAGLNPQRSPTFRSGRAGGWREHFSPEIRRLFKDTAGDLLVQLGYEQDDDW